MTIDSVGVDLDDVFTLSDWLESEKAGTVQRQLEEKITQMLFSNDPASPFFLRMAAELAWIGSRAEEKPFLEREIFALNFSNGYSVESCGFLKEIGKIGQSIGNAGKAVKNFVSDHAIEIAVGVAICATGIGIAAATGYTLSASVGGVVVAGAGSIFQLEEKPNPRIPTTPLPDPKACSQTELAAMQQDCSVIVSKIELPASVDEVLVTANGVWANGQFFSTDAMMQHSMFSSLFQKNFGGIFGFSTNSPGSDWKTFYTYLCAQQETSGDVSYQVRGESSLVLGNYNQTVQDLEKAIEANPMNPLFYLQRGAAYLGLGEYERSIEDYQECTSRTETTNPLSVSEFCLGFAKGLPKGTYESGEGMLLFLVDFVKHPIETSKQAMESITALVDLVQSDEWGTVAKALSPEVHQLVTEWDTLSSDKRGELAGYAVGKLGADILLPGALAKVASTSLKSAEELVTVCKNLQIVQETLVLETAAGIGNAAKVAEVVAAGQTTARIADELGFTAREMGQLKQAGKLETTVANVCENLSPPMKESFEFFKRAQDFLEQYKGFMPESQARELIHQTGVRSFPRPNGIPENFKVKISHKGAGLEYVHPTNSHIRVRVMPGKPHSPLPHQQKPYVVQTKEGKALDRFGNKVEAHSPEAHVPYEEFVYRG